ncbi:MAG: Tn3 family transposase [Xanthomonadaceae bacterium]|nr:Tn3 family transposase [Xanthomonadaceae bacterium]
MRDRSHDNQCCQASGLNLVAAAITLWNTVYPSCNCTGTIVPCITSSSGIARSG